MTYDKKRKYPRSGPDLCPRRHDDAVKNTSVLKSPAFKKACEAVGIKPTVRQASKFKRKMGLAYRGA